jgi:hypothetical protein
MNIPATDAPGHATWVLGLTPRGILAPKGR